jgi:hypothetical protein
MGKAINWSALVLRALTVVDGLVFLTAAFQNFGLRITAGPIERWFPVAIWQAGVGEAVIGVALLAAALSDRTRAFSVAYAMSVVGIGFGLLSSRVVGPARDIHLLLVPLAVVGVVALVWRSRHSSAVLDPGPQG